MLAEHRLKEWTESNATERRMESEVGDSGSRASVDADVSDSITVSQWCYDDVIITSLSHMTGQNEIIQPARDSTRRKYWIDLLVSVFRYELPPSQLSEAVKKNMVSYLVSDSTKKATVSKKRL